MPSCPALQAAASAEVGIHNGHPTPLMLHSLMEACKLDLTRMLVTSWIHPLNSIAWQAVQPSDQVCTDAII